MSTNVPNQYIEGLKLIGSLTNDDFDQLLDTLNFMEVTFNTKKLFSKMISSLRETAKSRSETDWKLVLETVFSLSYSLPMDEVLSLEKFIDVVIEDFSSNTNLSISCLLKDRVNKILSIKSLLNVSKAMNLTRESRNTFSDALIVSDIRPVLIGNRTEPCTHAFVVHNLRISYTTNSDDKEIYLMLDSSDIDYLMKKLDQAKSLEQRLIYLMNQANVANILGE